MSWTQVVGKMALVYFLSGLQDGPLDSSQRLAAPSSTLAWMEDLVRWVPGMTMLPLEQEMVRGRRGWVKGSDSGSSDGGRVGGMSMSTSGASSEDRSVGASEG